MGDAFGEGDPADGETPLRPVRLPAFLVDETTVTNDAFAAFVDATGHVTDAEHAGVSAVFHGLLTARLIREERPDQAIILYTAYLDAELEGRAARAGIARCVEKADGILTLERDIRRLATGSSD